jgi:hypothetical protein
LLFRGMVNGLLVAGLTSHGGGGGGAVVLFAVQGCDPGALVDERSQMEQATSCAFHEISNSC